MNDLIKLFLYYDPEDPKAQEEVDQIIPRINTLLKENGWEHTGFRNMYRPVKGTDCDETFCRAEEAVKNARWLMKYNPFFEVSTRTNICSLEEIVIRGMSPVSQEKMDRYREYSDQKGRFAHGIVVDENHVLRDGYTTYLIAKENGKRPDIMRVSSTQKFCKIVYGRHVRKTDNGYETTCQKQYAWRCGIREAVIPGDILLADTKMGKRLICAGRIFYAAGDHDCGMYRAVIRHTGRFMQPSDSTTGSMTNEV